MIGAFIQLNDDSQRAKTQPIGYVIQENGCWLWVGGHLPGGYGSVYDGKRTVRAHRLMYQRMRGPIPEGLTLDHLCRTRDCVNPWHCEPVTSRVNILRGMSATAINACKSHCVHGHPLSGRNLFYDCNGRRKCRICKNASDRRTRRARLSQKGAT